MGYLLDTHVLIWWMVEPHRLQTHEAEVINDRTSPLWVSAASVWEIEIKRALHRLATPPDLLEVLAKEQIQVLPILADEAIAAAALPPHHQDPFDRMLIAQAQRHDLTLITRDRAMRQYAVAVLEA